MRIIDTYANMLALVTHTNGHYDESAWCAYAGRISPVLPDKCLNDAASYDFERDVRPVLESAMNNRARLEEAHASFVRATRNLTQRFGAVFGMDLQVDIILHLGLCNGAGWATELDGKPAILLGMEKIIELGWTDDASMIGLIYHELGHIWHDTAGTLHADTTTNAEKAVWQLYQEGIAMHCEQLLMNDAWHYHQDKDGWLDWCKDHQTALFAEYKRRIDADESVQDFFGDWCSYLGHSDVGYYLGGELIKRLAGRYLLNELANLSSAGIYDELCRCANPVQTPTPSLYST